MGMSPQIGLAAQQPRGRFRSVRHCRVIMRATGKTLDEVLDDLAERSGLLGLSGVSGDVRDMEAGGGQRQRSGPSWRSTCSSPPFGTTWARIWSSSAGPTRSSSPAASARTASTFAPACAADLAELGIVLDPAANATAKGEAHDPRRRQPRADLDRADERRIVVARQTKATSGKR